jgi:nitrite reductase/ring-hydroxylating ferredoxin subunit
VTPTTATHQVSRRALSAVATAAAVGSPLLVACGSGQKDTSSAANEQSTDSDESRDSSHLASTSDIEVGSGTIFASQEVVVTQPREGEFKAFDTTCPHQGCQVGSVADGLINCPCHGSTFSIQDGSPLGGAATSALAAVDISVVEGEITLA